MNFLWPAIQDLKDAKKAMHSAAGCAFFVAFGTALITFLQTTGVIKLFEGISHSAYIDAVFFVLIGAGLLRNSRIAAVAGLGLYAMEQYFMITSGMSKGSIMGFIFTICFVHGVRGSFAYHSMMAYEKESQTAANPAAMPAGSYSGAADVQAVRKKGRNIAFVAALIFLCGAAAVAAYIIHPKFQFAKHESYSIEEANPKLPDASAPVSKNAASEQASSGESRTFHMKDGQTIRGKVVAEDEIFYTVETSGGKQEIVIKEDLA